MTPLLSQLAAGCALSVRSLSVKSDISRFLKSHRPQVYHAASDAEALDVRIECSCKLLDGACSGYGIRAISIEAEHFYADHVVVHSVIAILADAYRYGHHLEHVLRHDAFVQTVLADVSEGVERQIVCGGSHLADICFKTNIRWRTFAADLAEQLSEPRWFYRRGSGPYCAVHNGAHIELTRNIPAPGGTREVVRCPTFRSLVMSFRKWARTASMPLSAPLVR